MSAVYDKDTGSVLISARELVSYVYRGGDIDVRMINGSKIGSSVISHSPFTKKPNIVDAYAFTTLIDDVSLTVYTYPEGVREEGDRLVIENVYSVPYRLDDIQNGELDIGIHTAMCQAYIVTEKYRLSEIEARITYYREGTDEERAFKDTLSRDDLVKEFEHTVHLFAPFAKIIKQKSTKTIDQLSGLKFPFSQGAREGQREFIVEAFRTVKSKRRLVVEAPTGTGKTMASLYPSLKCIGTEDCDKIFYFTGKTTTAIAALNAVDLMRDQLPDLRSIHIFSKEKCCVSFPPGARRKCEPKHCHVTREYYGKINAALLELLENYRTYTRDIIDTVSAKYSVCAYELSLELSEWCELVVCDYNYLFDLNAYLRRYFETKPRERFVFLIDEAHNLPDRAREMYSATLTNEQFVALAARYSGRKHMGDALSAVLSKFEYLHSLAMTEKREMGDSVCGFYLNNQLPDDLCDEFLEFMQASRSLFNKDIEDDELHSVYMEVKHFLSVCEIFDKRFTMYIEAVDDKVTLRLLCLDPSFMLDMCMKKGSASILFSATLTPLEYFSDVLGCQKTTTLSLKSPFDSKNLCLIGVPNVSTRYEDRKSSASRVANIIRASIGAKQGNYIVYFPSYAYLTDVLNIFTEKFPKISVTCQKRSMSERAKKEFLDSFDEKKEGTLVGFCVMGGSFSEGIDLRGERLIGAIIVGVGLPTISNELNIIKEHFDNTRENGYAYTYTYPGMNKVMQAAGRVIRSEDEKGIVVLLDDRFASMEYKMIMPDYWKHIKYIDNAKMLLSEIDGFWERN